jgi:DNA (cytosine-5)-methyltransferase 1
VVDLFGGEGGAARGYQDAGFSVVSVDISAKALRRNPAGTWAGDWRDGLERWGTCADLIHASPPCQHYSEAVTHANKANHPDLIPEVRDALIELGKPYVMENVPGAPLKNPIELCGCMFDLEAEIKGQVFRVYRPRLFEASFHIEQAEHCEHLYPSLQVIGHGAPGWFYRKHGHGVPATVLGKATGTEWMTREGRRECIPPVFAKWVGEQYLSNQTSISS